MNSLNENNTIDLDNLEGDIETGKSRENSTNTQSKSASQNSFISLGSGMMSSMSNFNVNSLKPQEWLSKRRETLKPWTEFASFSKFKKPVSAKQCGSRLIKNVDYFQSNYFFVFIFLAIYCVITSPLLLFAFMAMAGAFYIIHLRHKDGNLNLFGKEFNLVQLYCGAGIISVPLFIIAGGGSAVFWIIGASLVVVIIHAVFYAREEQEDPFLNVV